MESKLTVFLIFSAIFFSIVSVSDIFAEEINADINDNVKRFYEKYSLMKKTVPTDKLPKFLNLDTPCSGTPCYFATNRPTPVVFEVKAIDYLGLPLTATCEHKSGHTFPMGPTRVHCIATDLFQSEVRGSFVVNIGSKMVFIPKWFKTTSGFWVDGKMDTVDYFKSIEYLINRGLISIPGLKNINDNPTKSVPSWVIQDVTDWANNKTGDHEFSIALSWFVENGFVKLK